jgi:hypothetical protein
MMGEHMIYLKLKHVFLLLIIFILDPELFIMGLLLFFLRLQLFIWGLQLSCALTIMDVHNFFKSKTTPELELYSDVNNATIVTSYDNPVKCVTVIIHPAFNKEDLLIVEEYDDEGTARAGHENWVKTFEKLLPEELKDVTNGKIYEREYFE